MGLLYPSDGRKGKPPAKLSCRRIEEDGLLGEEDGNAIANGKRNPAVFSHQRRVQLHPGEQLTLREPQRLMRERADEQGE